MKKELFIAEIKISPKKGQEIATHWLIVQSHPSPRVEDNHCSGMEWGNAEGLLPKYGDKPSGVRPVFYCYLLTDGVTADKIKADGGFNRTHAAGYDITPSRSESRQTNPGTFTLRGVDLGEISVCISPSTHHAGGLDVSSLHVRGYGEPSPGERQWLKENIAPNLWAYVLKNADAIHAAARESLHASMQESLQRARQGLAEIEAQIPAMLAAFDINKVDK